MAKAIVSERFGDLTGKQFRRLTVIRLAGRMRGLRAWLCRCECGNETTVPTSALRNGKTASCGCLRRIMGEKNRRHGACRTPEYNNWIAMKARCYNPKCRDFLDYGGRGIRVCERWISSFENFLADMGLRPFPSATIDRIDGNKDYDPTNCQWATGDQQASNKRNNKLLTHNGETKTLAAWARELRISHSAIIRRLNKGMSVEKALSLPKRVCRKKEV